MRTDIEARLRERTEGGGYLRPSYDDYCFGNVPGTIHAALGVDGSADRALPPDVLPDPERTYDRVLVVLVDGFGLEAWTRYCDDHPLLARLDDRGTVSPLTAIYPSETAAALTTFHTGRLPASHGVLGWDVYDPADDASYEAFTTAVTAGDDSVSYDLAEVYEGDSRYSALREAGVDPHHVVPFEETYAGATCHTYGDAAPPFGFDGFASALREAFDAATDPATHYAYLPQVDTAAHAHGTRSDRYRDAVHDTLDAVERALDDLAAAEETAASTLVLFVADHGHVDTDPDRNVDLEAFEAVMGALDRHGSGEPVRYAGSPRNLHLHLRDPSTRERVRGHLESGLDARVFTRERALETELFGDCEPSETFERRLGDLIVCHRDLSVWYGSDETKLEMIGMHGGLHPDEMLVPFAATTLDRLRT